VADFSALFVASLCANFIATLDYLKFFILHKVIAVNRRSVPSLLSVFFWGFSSPELAGRLATVFAVFFAYCLKYGLIQKNRIKPTA